jgi:hypothetical protein
MGEKMRHTDYYGIKAVPTQEEKAIEQLSARVLMLEGLLEQLVPIIGTMSEQMVMLANRLPARETIQ